MVWENITNQRKGQRMAAVSAVLIIVGLLLILPVGGSCADWVNGAMAPSAEGTRYAETVGQDGVTFNMDSTAFKDTGSFDSCYVWYNASGDKLYSNITHTAGVLTVTTESTSGNNTGNITADLSWAGNLPYYQIYFDYTALNLYQDNAVRIRLYIANIHVAAHEKTRTITLSAGGVTLFTTTIPSTDTDNYIDENITLNVNDLRNAIINTDGGETAYLKLIVKGVDNSLSVANSAVYAFNSSNLVARDDPVYIFAALAIAVAFVGAWAVQPHNTIPIGKGKPRAGGF